MRRSAQAKGIRNDKTTSIADSAEYWLFEPRQLVKWKGKLVDRCHVINEQLRQIHRDLRPDTPARDTQALRVVGRN
jgi:hypothetical protein